MSIFTQCESTQGNGGAIFVSLDIIQFGGVFIEGYPDSLTKFSQCSASQLGGAFYLDLANGSEGSFNLSGASYQDTSTLNSNSAQYGKSLFINAQGDLKLAVPVGQGIKIGAGEDSYEYANLDNLMG
ncbi:MAG: hypothetical protein EZS28_029907, partial [Streblomastix strix]